jgi:hypothetical protein
MWKALEPHVVQLVAERLVSAAARGVNSLFEDGRMQRIVDARAEEIIRTELQPEIDAIARARARKALARKAAQSGVQLPIDGGGK